MKNYSCKLYTFVSFFFLLILNSPSAAQDSKEESLPNGVTQEWLNQLVDPDGNRVLPEEQVTDALQRKIFAGLNTGERAGYSVSSAGDVNGDGFDDIIIGADGYSANTGRAYICYGGSVMNTVADVVMTGEGTNNFFGLSVAKAGDVNGDGYDDVVVGASGYLSFSGRAYIFFGGAIMNNSVDLIMTGEGTLNNFGLSVASAGDVNGDGYSDVIVGAERHNLYTGRAYIYLGGTYMDNLADVIMSGEFSGTRFGASVSTAGDVNGDGYSDVVIGAYAYSTNTGRAYIFFGAQGMNNVAAVTITGESSGDNFGLSVSAAGDINGDGYSDVIIGSYGSISFLGKAFIFLGGVSMDNVADVVMFGESVNNNFGYSVSSTGDVNGDGYSDVIVGAYGYSSNTGRAYVFFGGTSMNIVPDVIMTGENTVHNFGFSVSSAGDINNDGYPEMIVGAYAVSASTGRAYLFNYYMKNEITHELTMTGEAVSNSFGISISSAGDVNGDGFNDIIVGAEGNSTNTGKAYIYFGGVPMNNVADVTMTGEATNSYFGNSVSAAGDVNGDGYADIIVGSDFYNSSTGRAYIFYGGSSMNNVADVTMNGEAINNKFGRSVSGAGDMNGDGYADVIVGASGYSTNTGRAYIFFGGSAMNNIADITLTGEGTNMSFGGSVSTAGNVNGDNYADVVVGSHAYSGGTGRAYVYFGAAFMNPIADVVMTGDTIANYFGNSVSSGDVNGDGFTDVLVGAYGNSSSAGKAYVFYGGLSMNNIADVTMTGELSNHNFGVSVSSGDINGDGFADVLTGAYGYSGNTGRGYIYFGGADMNNIPDVTMAGETSATAFGDRITSAGDLNGDGYGDVIMGAYTYSSGFGRTYVYTGSAISSKPVLNYVKDIPNDQGGKVTIKWARSGLDVIGNNTIIDYVVYRSFPPAGSGFSWEQRDVISAAKRSFYSYTDNTPSDSSSGGSGTMFYQIMARTSNSSVYWLSGIMSGRSIDNIAPLMLSPFTAAPLSGDVKLTWGRSTAPDLLNYILFRSTSPSINPYTEPVFATTVDSTYIDTDPLGGVYYYFAVAQDIHNNLSPVAVAQSPGIALNLSMFIEGFYSSATNSQVQDTITVYLRDQNLPYAIVDEAKRPVAPDGNVSLSFTNATDGNYYIVLTHRNSIETWSASAVTLSLASPLNYSFTDISSKAYGNNLRQIDASPLTFGIYSGDENQDAIVNLTDILNVYNNSTGFVNGYVDSDMNGDNVTNLSDILITYNNSSLFVTRVRP